MKSTKAVTACICDLCKEREAYEWDACLGCGIDVCTDCQKNGNAVEYAHGVYFSGSGDGVYCGACDHKFKTVAHDALHATYIKITRLREESEAWQQNFRQRTKDAEEECARLYKIADGLRKING